jgi:hypothetical protein
MKILYTDIEINAPKSRVWQTLVDKKRWKYWNTFLFDRDPSRPLALGQRASLSLRRFPEDEETEFQPYVILFQPETCLRWIAKFPGFSQQYTFELQDIGIKRTKYVHTVRYSGILSRAVIFFIRHDEQTGMKRMARELKRYVESG